MGMRRPRDFAPAERKLRYLLYDLCGKYGYCIPPADQDRLARVKEITAEEFAVELLRAEGLDPEYVPDQMRNIVAYFVEQIGSDTFRADEYPS